MKNQQLFDRTVGILVNAYLNDTLLHQYCSCCAVGNLVAAGMGYTSQKGSNLYLGGTLPKWIEVTYNAKPRILCIDQLTCEARQEIESTGYSPYNIHLIEKAFESVLLDNDGTITKEWYLSRLDEKWQYAGLMAVVDCLSEIHEANESEAGAAKQLFTKELIV